ncbi:PREDICTED: TMV resistance [Prunus dulcis]|uniref:PREDICTED: TMV resistance n=1 Tax=Prunus dulcis TaxID=3755 RepID=A0A5E4GM95_PRUDU|nr:PREDICTED: TMV resistance [Prunus dulcis]
MNLRGCQSLEKIPDLSGIPNIKYLFRSECTSLAELDDSIGFLDGCVNLTKFGRRFRLKSLETLDLKGCASLESFPEIEVKMESLRRLTTKLRSLNLSGANFVTLPECISKFVSLKYLTLRDCKSLREIPQEVLPPRVCWVSLDNCTSLEKFPKLPLSSEVKYVSLMNCVSLRGYDIAENSILDQVSSLPHPQFEIYLPGDEVPKWFSCCKDATLVKDEFSSDEEEEDEYSARCEVCFEIPPNLDWETSRLVICVVNKGNVCGNECTALTSVHINGERVGEIFMVIEDSNVGLSCIPLSKPRNNIAIRWEKLTQLQYVGCNKCQIIFEFSFAATPVKILCGVHLLGHQLLMSASETGLGKRPRLSDVGDHEAQRGEADHPKRRHTDLNEEPKQ